MEERSRSAERLGILFLSHRNPIPEPVLGLRLFDSYAVCYGKLYPHLDYLRHWLREPNHQALFSEDNIREFDRLFILFKEGLMKDSTWLQEMWSREAHKGASQIWKDLKPLIEELQEKETTMLVDEVTREGHEARTPAAPLVSNEPQLWGSVFPSADDDQAFTNSE